MSSVEVIRGRARVEVEATIYGEYPDHAIRELRKAVGDVCRAIGTDDALRLAQDVTE